MTQHNSVDPTTLVGLDALKPGPGRLTLQHAAELATHLTPSNRAAGEEIQLDDSVALIFVRRGCVFIDTGKERALLLHAGSTLISESVTGERCAQPTFRAATDCELLTLDFQAYEELRRGNASLVSALLQSLLRTALDSAVRVDPVRSQVMNESSHAAPIVASVRLGEKTLSVPLGTKLQELLPAHEDGLPVVAALVDGKATSLQERVSSACSIVSLTPHHWEGRRCYRLSLALVAIEAARSLDAGICVSIGPSVGFGRRLLLRDTNGHDLAAFARELEERMHHLVAQKPMLKEELWTLGAARDYFSRGDWAEAGQLLETWRDPAVPVVSYGDVYALNTIPLLPDLARLDGFFLMRDADMLLLVYGKRSRELRRPTLTMPAEALADLSEQPRSSSPQSLRTQMVRQARSAAADSNDVYSDEHAWLRTLGVNSVGAFNHACVERSVPQLIRVAEAFQEKRIARIADEIQQRIDKLDVVCIAGPSSSGKTTFIRRLSVQLQVSGINPVALSLDDFYLAREETPRDSSGDYDFECLEALDIPLLHACLTALVAGEEVRMPRYDFVSGLSHPQGGPTLRLGKSDVLLLEGIHGLNPKLLGDVLQGQAFRIFVCPLMQLSFDHLSRVHASDVRLLRRIVRDRHSRGHRAAATIARWPKVRSGERSHIYPFQPHADAVFDSALVYELSVLGVYAERYLLEVPHDHPSYSTAFRLLQLLNRFVSIYPDQVPANSILREFIGGSGFEY